MRSAVTEASPVERRAAHRWLARVLEGARRAWQLAGAADGPDEAVAEALVDAARDALAVGGVVAQARALERAAALTPDDQTRARRLLEAGRVWKRAGRMAHAELLLEEALAIVRDTEACARIQLERGNLLIGRYDEDAALALLLAEADRASPTEPRRCSTSRSWPP